MTDLIFHEALEERIPGEIMYRTIGGSHSYGVARPDSDIDFKFVYVLPTQEFLSLYPPGERLLTRDGQIEIEGRKIDFVAHEVGKFARLLLKGNPNLVEYLWNDGNAVWCNEFMGELRKEAKRFLSQQTVEKYAGYCGGQLKRLQNSLSLHTTGGEYNTKWAYHMVRLMWTAARIANGREPKVKWDGEQREMLLEIRAGQWSAEQVIEYVRKRLDVIDAMDLNLTLPEHGDKEFLDNWVRRVRMRYMA